MEAPRDIETQAYVVEEPNGEFKLMDIILDEVREHEYLIEMKYSGICHTDNMLRIDGLGGVCKFPAIFGHEGAGYVRAVGRGVSNKDVNVGDFVLLSYVFCGKCKRCKQNHPAYCLHGGSWNMMATRPADGSTPARLKADGRSVRSQFFGQSSFAKMSVVQECCVVKYPHAPDTAAIFAACGCGFQTGAGTIMNVLKPGPEDSIVVFGVGSVGLPALMAAKYLGCKQIIAVDLADERLELARELGATEMVNPKTTPDFVAEVLRLTGGADYCLDCAGNIAVIEGMIECLARGGAAVSVGVPPPGQRVSLDPVKMLFENKRYLGVCEGDSTPSQFIPQLIAMQRSGRFPLERLCTTYDYRELSRAIEDMHSGKAVKPVIQWS